MTRVTVLVFDNCNASSVTSFVDVLCVANQLWQAREPASRALFSWRLVSPSGRAVATSSGLELAVSGGLSRSAGDVVYVPACHYTSEARLLQEVAQLAQAAGPWLAAQRRRGAWLSAGCSGVFVLARAGLLDGRVATTSWWLCDAFRREFPRVELRADELVTCGERLLCAGPVSAHYNLALRLVEALFGAELALRCSKVLLVDANRPSQRPYVTLQDQLAHTDELVVRAQEWMQRHLGGEEFSIEQLARAVGASPRNLIRRFKRARGSTPIAYAQALRIERAKNLLETTALDVAAILEHVGYRDRASFGRLFKQKTSLSPRAYRQRFAIGRAGRRAASPA